MDLIGGMHLSLGIFKSNTIEKKNGFKTILE